MHFFHNFFTRIINRFLRPRHFWRKVDFTELAELYTSRMVRSLAVGLISVLGALFLYENGYSIFFIILAYGIYTLYRGLLVFPAAKFVGYVGPKHASLVSNVLAVPALVSLTCLPVFGIWSLVAFFVLWGASMTIYVNSFMVSFSKVNHTAFAGKELGYMQIVEKIGTSLSPLLGGILAFFLGPQVTIVAASILFALSSMPLLFSPEQTSPRLKVSFKKFPYARYWKTFTSAGAQGADTLVSVLTWPLFLAVVVFAGSSMSVLYAEIGALSSVAILAAIVAAKVYGKLIDSSRGGALLVIGTVLNSGLHLIRIPLMGAASVVLMNITNEATTTAYRMPIFKGLFSTIEDELSGRRGAYIALYDLSSCIGYSIMAFISAGLVYALGVSEGLQAHYIVAAVVTLPIAVTGFRIYRKK